MQEASQPQAAGVAQSVQPAAVALRFAPQVAVVGQSGQPAAVALRFAPQVARVAQSGQPGAAFEPGRLVFRLSEAAADR
jgi:hypothetical protein